MRDYGVVVSDQGVLDKEATGRLRSKRRAAE